MKQSGLLLALVMLAVSSAFTQDNLDKSGDADAKPVMAFDSTTYNYGKIPYKGDGSCIFEFKNSGQEPLLLTNVRASCGCTTPSWPKKPIKPGDSGNIKVRYNTRIRGNFSKSIYVYSNAKNSPVSLQIKGQVVVQKE
jgi:hypothetical protein